MQPSFTASLSPSVLRSCCSHCEHHNWFRFSRFLLHIYQEGTVQLILWKKKYRHQPLLYQQPSGDAVARDTTKPISCYTDGSRWLSRNCCTFLVVSAHLLHQGFVGARAQTYHHRLCLCLCFRHLPWRCWDQGAHGIIAQLECRCCFVTCH